MRLKQRSQGPFCAFVGIKEGKVLPSVQGLWLFLLSPERSIQEAEEMEMMSFKPLDLAMPFTPKMGSETA